MTSNEPGEATEPWPFVDELYADPPWVMKADVFTAWFHISSADLEQYVAADLLPRADSTMARARLYRITAETAKGPVEFREAVLAFRSPGAFVDDELSFMMWTDSLEYMTWGREVFGWPLRWVELPISEEFWSAPGHTVRLPDCQLSVTVNSWDAPGPASAAPAARWVTPRRRLMAGAELEAVRDLLVVSPELVSPGVRVFVDADVSVGGWLPSASLQWSEMARGVELRVGHQVTIESPGPPDS